MVVGLPRLDPDRGKYLFYSLVYYYLMSAELYNIPLAALCLMVVDPEKYKMKGHDIRNAQGLQYAQEIAKEILKALGYSDSNSHSFYSSNRNHLEPADRFLHNMCLSRWQVVR